MRNLRIGLLAVIATLITISTASANDCDDGAGCVVKVTITNADCDGNSCPGPPSPACGAAPDTLTGNADLDVSGCSGADDIYVCQYWVRLPSTVVAQRCDFMQNTPNGVGALPALVYAPMGGLGNGSYEFRVFGNNVTGWTSCSATCTDNCVWSGTGSCQSLCGNMTVASDGSCSISKP